MAMEASSAETDFNVQVSGSLLRQYDVAEWLAHLSDLDQQQQWNELFWSALKKLQIKWPAQEEDEHGPHDGEVEEDNQNEVLPPDVAGDPNSLSLPDTPKTANRNWLLWYDRLASKFVKQCDEDADSDPARTPMSSIDGDEEPDHELFDHYYTHGDPDAIVDLAQSPPQMSICIMIVGTRGDVQPFIMIGKRLQQDGHRVRLATHAPYRSLVTSHGLEFYPLAGDPKELAAYMVKTGGRLIPYKIESIRHDIPRNMQMIDEIIQSTWPAVSAPDPDARGKGRPGRAFHANAIISNPVTYGHIHVAEKLGVPLHVMFPFPWAPTTEFPHPLSNLSYTGKPQALNYMSYKVLDWLMWQATEGMINTFRAKTLGLRKIRIGEAGHGILYNLQIPHSFLWTPILVPKPKDWDSLYHVVGTIVLKEDLSKYVPPPGLEEFLAKDDGAIFVGFGSMVLQNPTATTKMIIDAAVRSRVRVVIQSSWSEMSCGDIEAPDNVYFLGNCPHEWLFPRVTAVVHHGGAGTTAAGLLAGKPTFIVPFFADQPFWGRYVVKAGVGVEPCPINDLTVERLCEAFNLLRTPRMIGRAKAISKLMQQENGVERAVRSFYYHLPVDNMVCDVDRKRLATKWHMGDQLKLCAECDFARNSRNGNSHRSISTVHRAVDYSVYSGDPSLGCCVVS